MKKYIEVLTKTPLFSNIDMGEITAMLDCLNAKVAYFKKGDYVYSQGDIIDKIAVLVAGGLHIQNDDYWGYRSIINNIGVGEMFGEAFISCDSGAFPNDVLAVKDSAVIFFDVKKLLTTCSSACKFHTLVIQNLFFAISAQNRRLIGKLADISKRSTREKLMSYLSQEAARQNNSCFDIPFNRQQLADYLTLDRSAMSSELCRMRDQGFLRFEKNHFELLKTDLAD